MTSRTLPKFFSCPPTVDWKIPCEYDNVLCLEYEELLYSNEEQLREMAKRLTIKFRERFSYFFGVDYGSEGGGSSVVWD